MTATTAADLAYSNEQKRSRSAVIANGVTIYNNRWVAMDRAGYAQQHDVRADYFLAGPAAGQDTGNTSATRPPRIIIPNSGGTLHHVSVTGASALTDRDKYVYLTAAEGYTLTPPHAAALPMGRVKNWKTSTYCDVSVFAEDHWPVDEFERLIAACIAQGRKFHDERFNQLPLLGTSIDPSTAADPSQAEIDAIFQANRDYQIAGTGAAATDAAYATSGGGIVLTAAGSQNDETMLISRNNPASASWLSNGLKPNLAGAFLAEVVLPSTITDILVALGVKLTATSTQATDDDSLYIAFDTGSGSANFRTIRSVGGTDSDPVDTGVAATASTTYRLLVIFDASGNGEVYLGLPGRMVRIASGLSMTAAAALLPVAGVKTLESGGTARTLTIRRVLVAAA